MDKIWYINVDDKSEGPFSVDDLRRDPRVTPDTLVWREGFKSWKPIRAVPELKDVFADDHNTKKPKPFEVPAKATSTPQNELVLDLKKEPPYFFWFLILIAVSIYFLTQLFWSQW